MRIAAPLFVLAAVVATGAAVAQSRHNSSAPIDFAADHIELQDKANRAILSGNVRVTQAEMTLTAARITVAYTGKVTDGSPQVSRLDASGGVTVTRPDQRASGQYGVYDVNRRVIIMLGGVRLTQGANTVNGSRLTINLDTGKAVIDGGGGVSSGSSGATTTTGGRVTGRFSVPKRN
jgi:lipopolysaccharide export system protein LptA